MADLGNIGDVSGSITLRDNFAAVTSALDRVADSITKASTKMSADVDKFSKHVDETNKHLENLHRTGEKLGSGALSSILPKLGEGGEIAERLLQKLEGLSGAFESASETGGGFASVISGIGVSLLELGPLIAALAVAAVAATAAFAGFEFLKSAVEEGMKAQVVIEQLNNSLRANGAAAGYSAAQLMDYAESLIVVTGRDDDAIISGELILTRFHKIGHDVFPVATRAALDYAQATGKDLKQAFEQVGRALEGDTRGLAGFKDVGLVYTQTQKKMMLQLVETGHSAEEQKIILDDLNRAIGGAAESYTHTLSGGISIARAEMEQFKKEVASEIIPVLEDLLSDLVDQSGGWENIARVIKETAHDIGNAVRVTFLGLILIWDQAHIAWDSFLSTVVSGLHSFGDVIFSFVTLISNAWSKLPAALGGENAADITGALREMQSSFDSTFDSISDKIQKRLSIEAEYYEKTVKRIREHRLALEGDTEVQGKHNDAVDRANQEVVKLIDNLKRLYDSRNSEALAAQQDAISGLGYSDALFKQQIANKTLEEQTKFLDAAQKSEGGTIDSLKIKYREHLSLIAVYVEGIAKAESRIKAWHGSIKAVASEHEKLLAIIEREFSFKNDQIFSIGTQRFGGVIDFLSQMVELEKEAETAAEKRAKAYLQIEELIKSGSIDPETGRRLEQNQANPLFTEAEQKWVDFSASVATDNVTIIQDIDATIEKIQEAVDLGYMAVVTGEEAIRKLREEKYQEILGNASQVFGTLAEMFGGFFRYLQQAVDTLQKAAQTKSNVSSLASSMGASSGTASALGAVGAYVVIAKAMYDAFEAHAASRLARKYDYAATLGMEGTYGSAWNLGSLDQKTREASRAIGKTIDAFADAIGGVISTFAGLEVKVRKDGKYFRAFVEGQIIGQFDTYEQAVQAGLLASLRSAKTTISGVTDLVRTGLDLAAASTNHPMSSLDEAADFLTKLKEISQLTWSSEAQQVVQFTQHWDSLWKALTQVDTVTPSVIQGFTDLSDSIINSFSAWRRSITGEQESPAEQLARLQREGALFNARKALEIADLEARKFALESQALLTQGRVRLIDINIDLDNSELETWRTFTLGRKTLVQADAELTQASVSILQAQIDAINSILAQLKAIPDIDIPSLHLPNIGGSSGTDRQGFIDRLNDIINASLPPLGQQFAQYQKQVHDLIEEQKKIHAPIDLFQKALEALRQQFLKNVKDQANALAGTTSDFARQLKEGQDFFEQMRKIDPSKAWQTLVDRLQKSFLDKMKGELELRINDFTGISNPMLQISLNAKNLIADLEDLGKTGALTAAQIDAAKKLIEKGIEYQKQSGINSILDKLFGYFEGSTKYAQQALDLKKREIELQFDLIRAQLEAYGVLAKYAGLVNDAENAALKAAANNSAITSVANDNFVSQVNQTADAMKTAVMSLKDYQTSLRTDATLGLVNSRKALDNSKEIFESISGKAKSGDLTSIQSFQAAAETYRKNLLGFSPSSELAASELAKIDAAISAITGKYGTESTTDPVSANLAKIRNTIIDQTSNDNLLSDATIRSIDATKTTVNDASDRMSHMVMASNDKTIDQVSRLRDDFNKFTTGVLLAWRTEMRSNSDHMNDLTERELNEMKKINSTLAGKKQKAGIGG